MASPQRLPVAMNGNTLRQVSDDLGFHGRPEFSTDCFLSNPQRAQQLHLTIRRGAVASHRRHQKRASPEPPEVIDSRLDDRRIIGYSAPPTGDCDRVTGLNLAPKAKLRELGLHCGWNIVDLGAMQSLP